MGCQLHHVLGCGYTDLNWLFPFTQGEEGDQGGQGEVGSQGPTVRYIICWILLSLPLSLVCSLCSLSTCWTSCYYRAPRETVEPWE